MRVLSSSYVVTYNPGRYWIEAEPRLNLDASKIEEFISTCPPILEVHLLHIVLNQSSSQLWLDGLSNMSSRCNKPIPGVSPFLFCQFETKRSATKLCGQSWQSIHCRLGACLPRPICHGRGKACFRPRDAHADQPGSVRLLRSTAQSSPKRACAGWLDGDRQGARAA